MNGKISCGFKGLLSMSVLWMFPYAFGANAELKESREDNDLSNVANWNNWANNEGIHLTWSGHFTMSQDLTVHGFIADAGWGGRTYYYDLPDGRVLTVLGDTRHAWGSNSGESTRFWVTGGLFLVPETYWCASTESADRRYGNCAIIAPQRQSTATGHDTVFGVYNRDDVTRTQNAKVMVPMIRVGWGKNNWFVASNNAEVVVGVVDVGYNYSGSGNGNGILVDSGAQMTVTNQSELLIGSSTTSVSNKFVVSNGGKISGYDHVSLKGIGNALAFRGIGTDVTFPSASKSELRGVGNRIEVTGGAKLTLANAADQGRIWIGGSNADVSNVVSVSGAGSALTAKGENFLVSSAYSGSRYNGIRLSEGGLFTCKALRVGYAGMESQPAFGNWLRIESGAKLVDISSFGVGYGDPNTYGDPEPPYMWAISNRIDVVGGEVEVTYDFSVGRCKGTRDNLARFDGGKLTCGRNVYCGYEGRGSRFVAENGTTVKAINFYVGKSQDGQTWAGEGGRAEICSGSRFDLSGNFYAHGTNATIVVSNGVVVAGQTIQLPFYYPADRSCRIVVAGTNPVLRASNTGAEYYGLGFRYDTQVRFVVPKGGYSAVPFQVRKGKVNMANDRKGCVPMTFDLSRCADVAFETVLIESDDILEFNDRTTYLKTINDAMPVDKVTGRPLAKVLLTDGDRKLVLRYGKTGLCIILR